jgi:hypothetical protein
VWGGVGGDIESMSGGQQIVDMGGARVVDGGEDDVVFVAFGIGRGGVEEGKEDLAHLFEILVAEAAEEEGARLGFGKLRDGCPEGPGPGRVVRYVQQELRAFGEGKEFEAAWPVCVADSRLNLRV